MKQQKVLLIGPRSTEKLTGGMRIGFDLLISGFKDRKLNYKILNRSEKISYHKVGTFSIEGIKVTIFLLKSFFLFVPTISSIYITIGTSRAGFLRDMLMIWPARLLNKRIVLHLKGGGFLDFYNQSPAWLQFLIGHTFAGVDIIVVLGELLRDQFEFVPGIKDKLKVVPNGLPAELQNDYVQPKLLPVNGPVHLLYLSNMIPSKGYLHVLEACRILQEERQVPVQCDFCGAFVETINDGYSTTPDQAEAHFNELVKVYNLESVVTYHGTVRGELKQQFLQNAHLFLLPTAYPWEGQPISIIEALAFATPVITTRYRGIPEQVINDYNGVWVDFGSPEQIADAVELLWRNPTQYAEFSKNALIHFQQNFTQEAHLDRLIPIILGQ